MKVKPKNSYFLLSLGTQKRLFLDSAPITSILREEFFLEKFMASIVNKHCSSPYCQSHESRQTKYILN